MSKKSIVFALSCLLMLALAAVSPLTAQTTSEMESFLHGIGGALYAVAWPTATYKGLRFDTTHPHPGGGLDVVFVLHGVSAFSGGPLWTEVILTLQDWEIKDIQWGRHNAILSPPGATTTFFLEELNREINRQKVTAPAPSPTVAPTQLVQSWTLKDGCDDGVGTRFRFFDSTGSLVWPNPQEDYLLGRSQSRTVKVLVSPGTKICYGAAPDQHGTKSYWGIGLDGVEGCKDCCWPAETPNISFTLNCG